MVLLAATSLLLLLLIYCCSFCCCSSSVLTTASLVIKMDCSSAAEKRACPHGFNVHHLRREPGSGQGTPLG